MHFRPVVPPRRHATPGRAARVLILGIAALHIRPTREAAEVEIQPVSCAGSPRHSSSWVTSAASMAGSPSGTDLMPALIESKTVWTTRLSQSGDVGHRRLQGCGLGVFAWCR